MGQLIQFPKRNPLIDTKWSWEPRGEVIKLTYDTYHLDGYDLQVRLTARGDISTLPMREIEVDHKKRVLSTDQGGHIRFNSQKTKV